MTKHDLNSIGAAQVKTRNSLQRLIIILERKGILTSEDLTEIYDEQEDR